MSLHPESLLRVPLVDWLLSRSGITIETRPVDAEWYYRGILSLCPVGFDPFDRRLYAAGRSRFVRWRPHAMGSARVFNRDEWLVEEVLSLVHDGVHLLAVSELIADLWNGGDSPVEVTAANVDELAFIYVVSEAAATAGLDYWYLARVNLDEVCPIGTRFRGLTSSYREADFAEYQALCPSFVVQAPSFLSWLVDGYCNHAFSGFSLDDLRASARLRRWLGHELKMSRRQLSLVRDWIRHRYGLEVVASLEFRSGRRRSAVDRLARRLFSLARGDCAPVLGDARLALPRAPGIARRDYRFTNVCALPSWPELDASTLGELEVPQFAFFASQYLSAFELGAADDGDREGVRSAILARDFASLRSLAAGRRAVIAASPGPSDLIFTD